jgi:Tfp pilus assembly protein PilV
MWSRPKRQQGFVLPSVLLLGLVITTSGLALQAMALQGVFSQKRELKRDQQADAEFSAVMRQALD